MPGKVYRVEVCDRCLTASCWHGEFMCEESASAGIATRTNLELDELNRPDRYSEAKILAVCGSVDYVD